MNLHDLKFKGEKHNLDHIDRSDVSAIKSLVRDGVWTELECGCFRSPSWTGPKCPATWKYRQVPQECMHPEICTSLHG